MKRKLFVTSAAAALLAGTVLAAAQGTQKESPGGAGGIDRGGQGQMQHQPQGQGQREQGKGQQGQREQGKSETIGQGERERGKGMQGQREERKGQTTGQGEREQGKTQREQSQGQREGQGTQPGGREGAQQGGGGSVSFTAEQRTKIRQTVLQGGNAPRVNNVNFSLRVGTVVPQTVRVITVPEVLVEVHPQWRGYFYFIVGDQIIIVDRNHHIVAVFTV